MAVEVQKAGVCCRSATRPEPIASIPEIMPSPSKLQSKLLTSSDGTEIYSEAVGNPKKPHIVFVHGLTISGSAFDRIFYDSKFQQSYYLVRYDTRGHGRSGKPGSMDGHSSKLYADDFMEVVKAYGLRKPTYVGWSLGGIIVADITTHLPPDTLSGAVYIGSFFSTNHIPSYCTSFAQEQVAVFASPESTQEALRTAIIRFSDGCFDLYSDCVPYSDVDARARQLKRWDTQSAWLGYGLHQSSLDRGLVVSRPQDSTRLFELGKEGFPILILHGTQDALVGHQQIVKDAKEYFKNAKIVLFEQNGTHAIFHDKAAEVMKHIGAFAEEVQGIKLSGISCVIQ